MQVGEELHLHLPVGELLHPHPQEGAQVAHEAGGACGAPRDHQRGPMPPGHTASSESPAGQEGFGMGAFPLPPTLLAAAKREQQ